MASVNMRYGEGLKIVPLLGPTAASTDSTVSAFVNVANANWIQFLVHCGANDTTTVITVQSCTSNSTSGATLVGVPFEYRISGEMGTDTWGAITTCDSAGFSLTSAYADVSVLIDIDPQDLAANSDITTDYKYLRVALTCTSYAGNPINVHAVLEPRWSQNGVISAS